VKWKKLEIDVFIYFKKVGKYFFLDQQSKNKVAISHQLSVSRTC